MKKKWIAHLAEVNEEPLLVLAIIGAAGIVNFLVAGQRLVHSFYNLPTLLAACYFGRRRAMETAVASILFVAWTDIMNPVALGVGAGRGAEPVLAWSDLAVGAGFLLISAYATGTLYEIRSKQAA